VTLDTELIGEKVAQAQRAVAESDADAWVTFCRETDEIHAP